jgi:hypothetical protein
VQLLAQVQEKLNRVATESAFAEIYNTLVEDYIHT